MLHKLFFLLFFLGFHLAIHSQSDSSYQIREVSIRATRANALMQTTVSHLKPNDIESIQLGQDIPTLFQVLPSVTSGSDAGNGIGYSYMTIRGLDAQRVQVSLNGIPYNDAESHEVYWVNIPDIIQSAEDIQIQRGVGYSSMGGSGLGGSISIKTTKKYLRPFFNYSLHGGSFNTIRNSVQASTGILDHGWQLTARGSHIYSDGWVDRASSRLTSFFVDISKYGDKYTSHLIATHGREKTYQSWYGLSEADYRAGLLTKNTAGTDYEQKLGDPYPNQTDNYGQSHLQWIHNFYWNPKFNSSLTGFLSHGRGYYEEYKAGRDYNTYSSSLTGNGDLIRQLWLDNLLLGVNSSHIYEYKNISNVFAISFSNYKGHHFGKIADILAPYSGTIPNEYYENRAVKNDLTAFNKLTWKVRKSNITLDIQVRHLLYTIDGSLDDNPSYHLDQSNTFFNPKIGWNTTIHKNTNVYAFAGISHREPNRNDFVTADASNMPKPERVYDIELGQQTKLDRLRLSTNLFCMYFQDQLIPTGALNSVGAPIRQNVDQSYRAGFEGELEWTISKQWKFYTNQYLAVNTISNYHHYIPTYNADYSINTSMTEVQFYPTTDIANSPYWISYAELRYSPWKDMSIQLMNKIVSSQYLDNTSSNLKSLPTYSYTNLAFIKKLYPKTSIREITLQLLLNNLFDTHYIPRGYTYNSGNMLDVSGTMTKGTDYNYYYPQAGFNILLGLQVGF